MSYYMLLCYVSCYNMLVYVKFCCVMCCHAVLCCYVMLYVDVLYVVMLCYVVMLWYEICVVIL